MNTVDVDALERRAIELDHANWGSCEAWSLVNDQFAALRQQQEALKEKDERWQKDTRYYEDVLEEREAEIAGLRAALTRLVEVVETCEEYSYSSALESSRKALEKD